MGDDDSSPVRPSDDSLDWAMVELVARRYRQHLTDPPKPRMVARV